MGEKPSSPLRIAAVNGEILPRPRPRRPAIVDIWLKSQRIEEEEPPVTGLVPGLAEK